MCGGHLCYWNHRNISEGVKGRTMGGVVNAKKYLPSLTRSQQNKHYQKIAAVHTTSLWDSQFKMTIYNDIIVNVFFPTLRNHKIRLGGGGNENGKKQCEHVRHKLFGTFRCCSFTTATWNFLINDCLFLFLSLDEFFRIQFQKYSQPTDKLRLEKREVIFYAMFSPPSPSFLLKLRIFNQRRRNICVLLTW